MELENKEEQLASEAPLAISILNDLKQQTNAVNQLVQNVITRVRESEIDLSKGLSLLDVKNHTLLDYLLNLASVILHKATGGSIDGLACIDRLVELRTVIERMRPMEHKLKYQIDKLVRLATSGTLPENDPLRFKANPSNLMNKIEDGEESDEESDEGEDKAQDKKAAGVYVPPKLSAVHYDGDETAEQRASKSMERKRKQVLSRGVLQDLREEFMDTPVEVVEASSTGRHSKRSREAKEKQEFEETYFTRLQITKQDRHKNRQQKFVSAEDELFDIGGFGGPKPNKKTSKSKSSGKSKGGFKKKRKH
nr:EOG090X0IJO [Eulimnadia texana]